MSKKKGSELQKITEQAFNLRKGKKRDLVDILFIPSDKFGTGAHQCYIPASFIQNHQKKYRCVCGEPAIFDNQTITRADIIILQRQVNPNGAKAVAQFIDQSIATVVDLDDNFWDIPSTHSHRHLWPNDRVAVLNKMCEAADAVTVHSNGLKDKVAAKFPKLAHKLYRMPAIADFSVSPMRKPRTTKDEIRIGWVGASQHETDINPALHAVINLMRRDARIKLITMGLMDATAENLLPWWRRETYAFVPAHEFSTVLATMDLDIALAPVDDAPFHMGQSARKYLDYSSIKAATILRKAPPYTFERLEEAPVLWCKGHKVPNWERAIKELIETENWREMGEEAHEYCKMHFDGVKHIQSWIDIYKEIFDRKMERLYG